MTSACSRAAVIALGLVALSLNACKSHKAEQQAANAEPTAPSSEWVGENPTEAAVPVELPKTTMTNAPASEAATPPPAKK